MFIELTGIDNPVNSVAVGDFCYPTLVDIDGDGDLDMFSGDNEGEIHYFRNTLNYPIFTPIIFNLLTSPSNLADSDYDFHPRIIKTNKRKRFSFVFFVDGFSTAINHHVSCRV